MLEAYALGLGEPVAISAEHGEGLGDLHDALAAFEPAEDEDGDRRRRMPRGKAIRVAIVGRPNAGKSTLVNRMIGEERMLTGPEAGITRDTISVDWTWRDRRFRLFDTAGLRRKARVEGKLEKLAVGDTLRAIRFAEVVVLVLDVEQPFEKQDLQIADLVESEGRALVIAVDKWDLVDERQKTLADLRERSDRLLPQVAGVPLVPVSGLTGRGHRPARCRGRPHPRRLEPPSADRRAQSLARRDRRAPSAAGGLRAAHQAALLDPAEGAAAELRRLLLAARGAPRRVPALSGQRAPRGLRPARRAHPPDAEEGREPL